MREQCVCMCVSVGLNFDEKDEKMQIERKEMENRCE